LVAATFTERHITLEENIMTALTLEDRIRSSKIASLKMLIDTLSNLADDKPAYDLLDPRTPLVNL
jgi:hypothetical protein